ncbi:hypothetical protein C4E04_01000 [Microvirga sp. 17 mud 1-3]|nr:hypothetical protein C4E04_01000 [Microvirga sp. 17 mud 1-3]
MKRLCADFEEKPDPWRELITVRGSIGRRQMTLRASYSLEPVLRGAIVPSTDTAPKREAIGIFEEMPK